MPKDDWSDLKECFMDMAEEENKRIKLEAVKIFSEGITTPVEDGGLAPVDTGNWLANNMLVTGRPNKETNNDTDKNGMFTRSELIIRAEHVKPFNMITIQNNSDYNNEVEYSGWSKTPAYRPYRTAYEELKAKLDKL